MMDAACVNGMMVFDVDFVQYEDAVVSKVCYWLSGRYIVCRESAHHTFCRITLERPGKAFTDDDFDTVRLEVSQSFADFKLRAIIGRETHAIRNILYIKAFANNDDFEDYNLTY